MEYKIGDKIKTKATRVPIYADPYYTPAWQETTKTLEIIKPLKYFGYDKAHPNGWIVKIGKKTGAFIVVDNQSGTLTSGKCKWELELPH
jgi:hypothetical protein